MTLPLGTPVVCPVIVGRTSTLDTLHRLVEATNRGLAHTIMVSGEAGIGKTRLAREAAAAAAARGFMVLQVDCFQHARAWPYAPLLDLLRAYFATLPAAAMAEDPAVLEVVRLLPELKPPWLSVSPATALEPEQEKRRLFTALSALFGRLASRQPLLLIIEDLHWSDENTLDFLLYLVHRVRGTALLLLTFRDGEERPSLSWLAQLDRARLAHELRLQRLSRDDVHAMLRAMFALRRPVRPEFLDTMYALTEGNPFFVEEILSALIAAGDIFYVDGEWDRKPMSTLQIPRSVHGAVQQRVDQVGAGARRLLDVAAVGGRSFDATVLQELARLDDPALVAALKELVSARLVVEETPDRFTFRHALTREVIYGTLLARERVALHRLWAEALARRPAPDRMLGELAYHFYAAEVWPEALEYNRRAAERALARYAPRAAVEYLDRALHAAELLCTAPTQLLRMRAQMFDMLDDFERACNDLERVLIHARTAGDRHAEGETLLDLGKLWASRDYGRTGSHFQQALALARELDDSAMLGHSLNCLGNWFLNSEQPDEARRCHDEALAIFMEIDDRRGIAATLDLLGMTNYLGGDLLAGTASYERAAALFRELDDRVALINCLATLPLRGGTYQTNTMVAATTLLEADAQGQEALAMARAIGWRSGEAFALIFVGFCLSSRGDYAQALDVLGNAVAIAEEIAHRQWTSAARCALGAVYLDLLAPAPARSELEAALALARETDSIHWIHCTAGFLAAVYLQLGQLQRADELLNSVLAPDAPAQTLGQRLIWCARADLALARGDAAAALAIVEVLEGATANRPPSGPAPALRLLHLRADILAALDRPVEAAALLHVAAELADRQGARPVLWRVHVSLGHLLRREERHHESETACAAARDLVESLAAGVPEQDLRDAFVRGAIARLPPTRTRSARRLTRRPVAPLTARECEIAAEVARGNTNAAIAATLVLSERTVESHISNILAKLGFSSRAAIAAWATRAGLGTEQNEQPER